MDARTPAARPVLALAIALGGVAACGTTVPQVQHRPAEALAPADQGDGLQGGAPTGVGPGAIPGGEPLKPGAARPVVPQPSPGASRLAPAPARPGKAPGVTADALYVGAWYVKNAGSANAAVGADTDPGDGRAYWNALINDANARGGIAGRRVKGVFYGLDAQSTQSSGAQMEAACQYWTKDHEVFAILNANDDVGRACAEKAGALAFGMAETGALPSTYSRYPHTVEPSALNLVRAGRATVEGLAQQGWFKPGMKIGLVTYDDPGYRTAERDGYRGPLRKLGMTVSATAYLAVPHSLGDVARTSADARAAVLRFATEGIDHVLLVDGVAGAGSGILTLEFVLNAEGQHYRPRYGLNSANLPALMAETVPRGAFERALAVGWAPIADLAAADDPDSSGPPARRRCKALMRSHGVTLDSRSAQDQALAACDSFWFLSASVTASRLPLSRDGVIAAAPLVGARHESPLTFLSRVSATRRDGVAQVRHLAFLGACSCWRYTSPAYGIG